MKTQLQRALMGAATGVSLALAATAANATRPPLDPAPSPILVQGYYAVDVGNSGFVGLLTDTSGATGFGLTPGGSNANVAIGASLAGNTASCWAARPSPTSSTCTPTLKRRPTRSSHGSTTSARSPK